MSTHKQVAFCPNFNNLEGFQNWSYESAPDQLCKTLNLSPTNDKNNCFIAKSFSLRSSILGYYDTLENFQRLIELRPTFDVPQSIAGPQIYGCVYPVPQYPSLIGYNEIMYGFPFNE